MTSVIAPGQKRAISTPAAGTAWRGPTPDRRRPRGRAGRHRAVGASARRCGRSRRAPNGRRRGRRRCRWGIADRPSASAASFNASAAPVAPPIGGPPRTRSRTSVRSARTSTSSNPPGGARAATRVGLVGRVLDHERAGRRQPVGRAGHDAPRSPRAPSARRTSAPRGSQSATSAGSALVCRRRRAGWTRPGRPRPAARRAARRTSRPSASRTRARRPAEAGQVGPGHGERVGRHVGGPHLDVGHLDRERQGDGARAGAEVDDDRRALRRARRSSSSAPPRRPTRSRAGGSAPAGRRRGRGGGSPSAPSTYCSGSPAAPAPTMSSTRGHGPLRRRLVEVEHASSAPS